jgi:hypothetical protein
MADRQVVVSLLTTGGAHTFEMDFDEATSLIAAWKSANKGVPTEYDVIDASGEPITLRIRLADIIGITQKPKKRKQVTVH